MHFFIPIFLILFALSLFSGIGFAKADLICPESEGNYFHVNGTESYEEYPFDEGFLTILYCEFEASPELEEIPYGEVYAVYNFTGELTPEMIVDLECGSSLGEQFYPIFVSSTTHFASVAFSTSGLVGAASQIMTQIEEQNLSPICTQETEETAEEQIEEESIEELEDEEPIQEIDEEFPENEEPTIEISNDAIKEKSIEEIVEDIEEFKKNEEEDISQEKMIIELGENEKKPIEIILPDWIKTNADGWASDQIQDSDFVSGIEYMINEGIIKIPSTEAAAQTSSDIPRWVKSNAGWWADGLISNNDFVNGLQYLISNGIITVA